MNKLLEKYFDYFYLNIHKYNFKEWIVYINAEQRNNDLPSRIVMDPATKRACLYLNELVVMNQSPDIVIDKPLRTLCCLLCEKETERLIIRHFTESDYMDYKELVLQSSLRMWEGNKVISDESEIISYLNRDINDPFKFAIYEKNLAKVIGHISIHPCATRSVSSQSMGYGLSALYHKQGYMKEASRAMLEFCFEELGIELVEASYFDGNEASAGVIRSMGMVYEGYRRYGYYDANQGPMHIHVCSITRDEYFEKK